jgi:archaellum component FlaC
VTIGDTPLPPIRKRHLRALWVWVGPIVVTALTSAYGYVRGYAKGLADAAERLARIEQAAKTEGTKRAALEQRVTVTEDDLNHAFAVNRDQDKKNADEDAAIERLGQRVTELARQKPIVVKPER